MIHRFQMCVSGCEIPFAIVADRSADRRATTGGAVGGVYLVTLTLAFRANIDHGRVRHPLCRYNIDDIRSASEICLTLRTFVLITSVQVYSGGFSHLVLRRIGGTMPPRPALSKGELQVARMVWRLGEATVGQVFEELSSECEIDYSTVQTYIRRLEQKGYIRAKRSGRNKIYSPKVRPGQVIKETVDDLMLRLFDGEVLPLMRHLIHDRDIRPEQIQELRDMLNEVEDGGGSNDDD